MSKSMFAHPLDLIMIYLGNICSNVPHVSFIFNQCEWIRNGSVFHNFSFYFCQCLFGRDLIILTLCPRLLMIISWFKKSIFVSWLHLKMLWARMQQKARTDEQFGNNLSKIKVYLSSGRRQLPGKLSLPRGKCCGDEHDKNITAYQKHIK